MTPEDALRSKRAISNGLWAYGHTRPNSPESVNAELLTAILTELVAAREDRAARRAGPNIKIGG